MPNAAKIVRLEPHAPLPEGRHLTVMRRLDEDDPRRVVTELVLGTGAGRAETSRPVDASGAAMGLEKAIEAAGAVAGSEGLHTIFVIDRTAGPRERDVLEHGGDHSVHMEGLQDTDMEEGEPGPDMRDAVR